MLSSTKPLSVAPRLASARPRQALILQFSTRSQNPVHQTTNPEYRDKCLTCFGAATAQALVLVAKVRDKVFAAGWLCPCACSWLGQAFVLTILPCSLFDHRSVRRACATARILTNTTAHLTKRLSAGQGEPLRSSATICTSTHARTHARTHAQDTHKTHTNAARLLCSQANQSLTPLPAAYLESA